MHFLSLSLLLLPFAAASPLPQENKDIIPGQYIVTLKDGLTAAEIESHRSWVTTMHRSNLAATGLSGIESEGIHGHFQINKLNLYSGGFDKKTVEELKRSPYVKSVLPDQKVYLAETVTQSNAIWNLGHMSNKGKESESWDSLTEYKYDSAAGEGVWAYVLDTGINVNHVEFEGRAILGRNAITNKPHLDTFGHGTYVGGIIAAKTFGVAKKANVVSAKAFDGGSSSYRYIFDAYDWIVKNITDGNRQSKSVINLSICKSSFGIEASSLDVNKHVPLAGSKYQPFDDAIENAFKAGITTVVASGNDGRDASQNTPASAPNAITVGAVRWDNTRPSFSNFGRVVDIFAPGEIIKSCWIGSNSAIRYASGTSAASPHVAGLVAYLMSMETFSSPSAVTARVLGLTIPDVVKDARGSANKLAYNGIQERR
ncbi:hypothetical protein UREG_07838 [Uncinocarpus reesii 1704]|uniref:Uncharacterized protein n=1 Tax=Uncinocarpus reesii (strain UAMH 1704) TaxID=336963 RepID=C4K087_UNCRE|nr:uncharacterized protein UREG_07838 [Uncinocarpus reesii 1704]EEP82973.1 hypothetical protein UREG_07838 [Uncinocarpus reesii 1704]